MLPKQTILILLMLVSMFFMGCGGGKSTKTTVITEQYEEYLQHYFEATGPFADDDLLRSTIDYMDEVIANGGHKTIRSIFYDKARLLYKLKQYDKALDTLYQGDDDYNSNYLAALLIILGRENEAIPLLEKQININKKALTKKPMLDRKRNGIIQGLLICYLLEGKPHESILSNMVSENIATKEEILQLLRGIMIENDLTKTKENILESMWPE